MGFFDDVAYEAPRPPARPHRPWDQPEAAFPGVAAVEVMLAHNEQAAVAVTGIWAYTTGFEIGVSARTTRTSLRSSMILGALAGGEDDGPRPEFLRIGVRFSNGDKITNLTRPPERGASSPPGGPILRPAAFGGGWRAHDARFWVWPLPPSGPVTFACEWPAAGIPESRAEVDARLILDAAARSVQLWPEPDD